MSLPNKIVTKFSNNIFKMSKASRNTVEEENALREKLTTEIEERSKACSNPTFNCTIPRLEGYAFCIRHILQDARAPYKPCAYIYPNGKKCMEAAPKYDMDSSGLKHYCFEHNRLVQLNKTHEKVGQYKQVQTNEAFLNDLKHHININNQDSPSRFTDTDEEIDVVSSKIEPFINYVHIANFDVKNEDKEKRRILDYASDSSSNDDKPSVNNTWKAHECESSDTESVDSQKEDVLKHAGIYTIDEATNITKQKMIRLQKLYMDQISRLQYVLREKRRKYLQAIRKERETLCSIHDQPKDTPQERRLYEKLKALNHYHKRHGIEAVLYKKFHEKRLKACEALTHKGPLYTKCIFTEGGVKCGERALPCCKYCKKHILEDKKQILFRACGVEKSGIICQEPVANIFEDVTCILHINLPIQKTYTQKKFESEAEEEEEDSTKKSIKVEVEMNEENVGDINGEINLELKPLLSINEENFENINGEMKSGLKPLLSITEESNENDDVDMITAEEEVEKNIKISHELQQETSQDSDSTENKLEAKQDKFKIDEENKENSNIEIDKKDENVLFE